MRSLDAWLSSGGRDDVRRGLGVMVLSTLALLPLNGSAQTVGVPVVREEAGVYFVSATLTAEGPSSLAIATLTDYENIPRFMHAVQTSRVVGRGAGVTRIDQEAKASFLWFDKRIHLTLEVREEPGTIRFIDVGRTSFERYEGVWTISDANGHTTIRYELAAKPSFEVPGFLLKRLLKRDAQEMIAQLQGEIAARFTRRQEDRRRGMDPADARD